MQMKRVSKDSKDWTETLEGVRMVTGPVKASIGYGGMTVEIQKPFTPIITKDGKQIANEVQVTKATHRLGVDKSKMVSRKVDELAHDSTSTSLSLWDALIHGSSRLVEETNLNCNEVARGIRKTTKYVVDRLWKLATPIKNEKQLKDIAHIASNSDESISEPVFEAFKQAGEHNPVIMDESLFGDKVEFKIQEGLHFDNGLMHPMFMTNPVRGTAEFENAQILILTEPIASGEDVLNILDRIKKHSKEPLLIISEMFQGQVMGQLIVARHPHLANRKAEPFPVVAVKMPHWGVDQTATIEDISLITGAKPIGKAFGVTLTSFDPAEHLGNAKNIVVYNNKTVITGGAGDKKAIKSKIAFLEKEMKKPGNSKPLQERVTKLSGKVAVVTPGASTDIVAKEIRFRVEDAIGSVRTAKEHGYLPGGATAFYRINRELLNPKFDLRKELGLTPQEEHGAVLLLKSLLAPVEDNINNVGRKMVDDVFEKMGDKPNFGYNGATNKVEDLVKAGVIDSAFGQITALEIASDISATTLTSKYMIVDDDEAEDKGTPDNPFIS